MLANCISSERQINGIPADAVSCDVLVIGAGASEIPAGIAAAMTSQLRTDIRNISIPELQNRIQLINKPVQI